MTASRIPGFHRLSLAERRSALGLLPDSNPGDLPVPLAEEMVENVLGTFALPLGVVMNLRINGVDRFAPMAVEEPSVVAAASNASKMARAGGGFVAEADEPVMIAQILLTEITDPDAARVAIEASQPHLLAKADEVAPGLVKRGGGTRGLEVRWLGDGMLVVHLLVDCRDAMGANAVNTMAEAIGGDVAELANGVLGMRILSNLADRRLVRVSCCVPFEALKGRDVAERIELATRFANADPYRATTHNKGVMNGIDAVLIACGQDWRGVEAGAHAFAARDGQYRSLTRWWVEDDGLHGSIELPMAVGTAGGATRVHPGAQRSLALLAPSSASDLGCVAAAVGLANNLAALRALVCEGIQSGHMRLHGRSVRAACRTRWWMTLPAPDLPVEWLLDLLPELEGRSCFAARDGREVAGLGEAAVVEAQGPNRIDLLAARGKALLAELSPLGDSTVGPPTLMGGFAFADRDPAGVVGPWRGWASARMVLPEVQLRRDGDGATLLAVAPPGVDQVAATLWLRGRLESVRDSLVELAERLPGADETLVDTGAAPTAAAWGLATTPLEDTLDEAPWPAAHGGGATSGGLAMHAVAAVAPMDPYEGMVTDALEAIEAGAVSKVTVARARRFGRLRRRAPVRVLRTLRRRYPDCFRFWIEPAGGSAFVGASPERLVARRGRTLRADALAGTVGRSTDPAADANLGALLLANNKEQREHEAVVAFLRRRLAPFANGSGIEASRTPQLLHLVNVQHLHTPFVVKLSDDAAQLGALQLAAAVHPTPAVAGVPAQRATDWIARHEELDRGWYAGGVGVLDADGDGEFCVAIRSGLFEDDALWLFAGAGIVAGSDPDRERAEVEQKMRALRDVLVED